MVATKAKCVLPKSLVSYLLESAVLPMSRALTLKRMAPRIHVSLHQAGYSKLQPTTRIECAACISCAGLASRSGPYTLGVQ